LTNTQTLTSKAGSWWLSNKSPQAVKRVEIAGFVLLEMLELVKAVKNFEVLEAMSFKTLKICDFR
jgi:hypothetical protein